MPIIIDNLGSPMLPTEDPNLWIGNLGTLIDIRYQLGSLGSPLITIPTQEELKMEIRNINLNILLYL